MKILSFAASNSRHSINKQLLIYAESLIPSCTFAHLDMNDYEIPIYSEDREAETGIPIPAQRFRDNIAQSDALLIAFAEHNGGYTAVYKNLFDWASRIGLNVYQDRPIVMLATSPGVGGAKNVLHSAVTSAPIFSGNVLASLSIPCFYDNFDTQTKTLKNLSLRQKLEEALLLLQQHCVKTK